MTHPIHPDAQKLVQMLRASDALSVFIQWLKERDFRAYWHEVEDGLFLVLFYRGRKRPLVVSRLGEGFHPTFWDAAARLLSMKWRETDFRESALALVLSQEMAEKERAQKALEQVHQEFRDLLKKLAVRGIVPMTIAAFESDHLRRIQQGHAGALSPQATEKALWQEVAECEVRFQNPSETATSGSQSVAGVSEFEPGNPNPGGLGSESSYQEVMRRGSASDYHRRKNEDYQ